MHLKVSFLAPKKFILTYYFKVLVENHHIKPCNCSFWLIFILYNVPVIFLKSFNFTYDENWTKIRFQTNNNNTFLFPIFSKKSRAPPSLSTIFNWHISKNVCSLGSQSRSLDFRSKSFLSLPYMSFRKINKMKRNYQEAPGKSMS